MLIISVWAYYLDFSHRRPPPISNHFVVYWGWSLMRELTVFQMGVLPPGGKFDFNSTTYLLGISLFHTWCTLNFYSKKKRNLVNLYLYLSDIQQDKLWHISYFHQEFQVLNNYLGNVVHIWTHQSKKKKITLLIQLIELL